VARCIMKSNPIRFVRDSRGQSLIEFALILPDDARRHVHDHRVRPRASTPTTCSPRPASRAARVPSFRPRASYQTKGQDRARRSSSPPHLETGATLTVAVQDNYNGSGMKVVVCTITRPFTWVINGRSR
jgi:hypothetical protein